MTRFMKGLKIAFWNVGKTHLIEGKIQFKATVVEDGYMVDAFKEGAIIVHSDQIAQVLLKDMDNNDIWVNVEDLYAFYPRDEEIGPDTIYKRRITGSRNSGRYPWSGHTNKYILHVDKLVAGITPKKVIFNGPATIVIWQDGTKTVVKKTDGDTDDREKAVMYAILKKQFGSRAEMNRYLKLFFKEEHNE